VIRNEVGASAGLYDTTSGRRLRELVPEARNDDTSSTVHYPPHALVFAPDGRTFITTSLTDGVRLYDADGKAGHRLIEGREVAFLGIALSPDGRSLATAAVGGKVRLWEVATGGERRAFGPDQERASAVAFSADGKLLAGSGTGGVVRVWQSATGRELHSFRGHDSELSALTFAADGKLLSVSHDGTVLVWDTSGLKSGAAGRPGKLDPDAAWASLSGGDAAGAYEAIARLEASPEEAVGLLRERLKPAEAADAKRIDGLIARLDADDFAEREKATRELGKLGVQAQGALRKAAKAPPSAEVARRIADLLQKIEGGNQSGEALRQTRALEVLEAVGTPQAKDLLGELAKGAPDVPLTQEAKASLERLVQRRATR